MEGNWQPTFAEFFAGIGLVRHGLQRSGWRVAFANDMDARKKQMYEAHFGPAPYYNTEDIHALAATPAAVPTVDLAHASFPCTDLSLAGARKGLQAGQSSAFWGFHHLLENLGDRRPPLILIENVVGFLSSRGGEDFAAAMRALNGAGYRVDPFIVDAVRFVPQSRPRLFVVGIRRGCDADQGGRIEACDTPVDPCRTVALRESIARLPDVDWCIRMLPSLPQSSMTLDDIVEDPPEESPDWWSAQRAEYLYGQMSERHRRTAEGMIAGRRWSYGTVFRRVRRGRSMAELRTDGVAGCLRTPKGGSGRQILFKAGFGSYRVRLVSPPECAALMGAPGYRIKAKPSQALFGFGDAVCADVIDWIARAYLNPLLQHTG